MVAKSNIQTIINVSTKYTASQRKLIGEKIVEKILSRTAAGLDKNGIAFKPYNPEYAKEKGSSHVDLSLTHDMLTELDVVDTSIPGQILIGYPEGHVDAGKVEGNQTGVRGKSSKVVKPRPFIGVSQKEKDLAIAQAEQSFGDVTEDVKRSFVDSFMKNLLGKQGADLPDFEEED